MRVEAVIRRQDAADGHRGGFGTICAAGRRCLEKSDVTIRGTLQTSISAASAVTAHLRSPVTAKAIETSLSPMNGWCYKAAATDLRPG